MYKPWQPKRWSSFYNIEEDTFPQEYIEQTASFIRDHPLLATTTLNSKFTGTQGFSIAFTRSGFARLDKSFPLFSTYIERVALDCCNAFFLNPLVIAQGSAVDIHIDRSLGPWTRPEECPFPIKVSVLYIDLPQDLLGGDLSLHLPFWALGTRSNFTPKKGRLFEFRGDLRHQVSEVKKASAPRISLVLESYSMPVHLLEKLPQLYTRSTRSFDSFLEDALTP